MPPELSDFLFGTLTPAALALSAIALIIASFARGWIVSRFVVEALLKAESQRAELYKALYETEKARGDVLDDITDKLKVVGEQQLKILQSLPIVKPQT